MSKSVARVVADAAARGVVIEIVEAVSQTKTAAEAAAEHGVAVDQIVKSIIFRGEASDLPVLFLTAGGRRVDLALATALAGEALGKADAAFIRATTGFAIGGVSPFGHTGPVTAFFDRTLTGFDIVWAAAGTPRHNFAISPAVLMGATGARLADFTEIGA